MQLHNIYEFFPMFSGGLIALSLLFKIHKRSVSTFIHIISQAVALHLVYCSEMEIAIILLLTTTSILLIRAMLKDDNDKLIIHKKKNVLRRAGDVVSHG